MSSSSGIFLINITADYTQVSKLIDSITAEYLLVDKSYDSDEIIVQAESQGMIAETFS